MSSVKQKFPNREALRQRLDVVLQSNLADFLSSTHVQRQAVIGDRNYALLAVVFSIAILFSMYFVRIQYTNLVWNIFLGCAILWLTIVLLSARRWLIDVKILAKEVNMALAPIISDTLDRTVIYSSDADHRDETLQLLHDSALITTNDVTVVSDDMLTVYDETKLTLRELMVTKKNQQEGGQKEMIIFKGVLVVAKLPFTHNAETYLSTEGDRVGFAHRTFWSDLFEGGKIKEAVLEWNDFEKDLHVATSDEVATREVLTPELMQDLYDWWLEHKLNIRVAIKGDTFYMLLPESSIQVGFSTNSTELSNIRTYACSLLTPLWRSLVLVEDVTKKKM
ncbi:MAG: DUF3137 domain-containing protein [Candidatus Pacebacteria bacterium]|nr:DUF3137 domain-containing protein [Candidatus Paceibacterota bacterium]